MTSQNTQEQQDSQQLLSGMASQNAQEQQDSQQLLSGMASQNAQEQQDSQQLLSGMASQNAQEQQDSQQLLSGMASQNAQEQQDSQQLLSGMASQNAQEQQDSQQLLSGMASQNAQEQQDSQGGRAIELIRCIPPTDEERKNPRYIPQLEIDRKAQKIIAERFEAPISIIVYVGNMGVGKSKLSTITVAALENKKHHQASGMFRSGAGTNGVTQGVWMWSEPLQHPNQEPDARGSILILDCEGMGDLDENTGANLYLFCMLISTAFIVVLRPPRVDRYQCNRLYQALRRFERMRTQYVLPNLWLLPLDLREFVYSDHKTNEDVVISEEEWVNKIFTIDEKNSRLPNNENQALKERYQYIVQMLPKIQATNIDYLPQALHSDNKKLDTYSLLHSEESSLYATSINTAINKFLASGGKRLLGSIAENMFVRPSELAKLMGDLIEVINRDPIPNPDELINQYLQNRFTADIEKEYLARFERDLASSVTQVCEKLSELQSPPTEEEIANIIEHMKLKHRILCKKHMDKIICHTRHEILGFDSTLMSGFPDENERQQAIESLPAFIQYRLNIIETKMSDYHEPILLIERAQHKLIIKEMHLQTAETKKLLAEAMSIMNLKKHKLQEEKRIHESLNRAHLWRVGLPPCNCGARGGAYNLLHVRCNSDRRGNLYYYDNKTDHVVCDSCRKFFKINPRRARCNNCETILYVTKVF